MVFSSVVFLFYFLPFVLAGYYLLHWLAPRQVKHAFLTLVSNVFYGWANPLFSIILVELDSFVSPALGQVIAVRGSGATPTRIALYKAGRSDPEFLSSKKVVIWLFTAREFTETTGWAKLPATKK